MAGAAPKAAVGGNYDRVMEVDERSLLLRQPASRSSVGFMSMSAFLGTFGWWVIASCILLNHFRTHRRQNSPQTQRQSHRARGSSNWLSRLRTANSVNTATILTTAPTQGHSNDHSHKQSLNHPQPRRTTHVRTPVQRNVHKHNIVQQHTKTHSQLHNCIP